MTVPATCRSGHAVLPGESYCPSCGEYLHAIDEARAPGTARPFPAEYPYGGYPPPYGLPYPPYGTPPYPPQGFVPYPTAVPYPPYGPPPYPPPQRVGGYDRRYSDPRYSDPRYYGAPVRAVNGLAIASFVLGLLWFWWIGSILAVVFGHIALREIRRRGQRGHGIAIAGAVLGWIGVATLVIVAMAGMASS